MSDEQTTVDNYIEKLPQSVKEIFLKIREIVKSTAPNSEELMKWDMPSYYINGRKIIVIGASKNHLGIYGVKPETFKDKLQKYKYSKGCIQFQYKEPVPYDLITEIVKCQINVIEKEN
jgi:uncharacterized protein YdhG (YjbR/CyaY superfamily)